MKFDLNAFYNEMGHVIDANPNSPNTVAGTADALIIIYAESLDERIEALELKLARLQDVIAGKYPNA